MSQKFAARTSAAPTRAVVIALSTCLLAACAGGGDKGVQDTRYVARDVSTLYNSAKQKLDAKQYALAAALFDEVERQHPFSPWARRAQLMSSFSYYMARKYTESINAARRFLQNNPGNKDAAYAYYLIGVSYYEQINDVTRDQKITELAQQSLNDVIRLYPDSRYAADARQKVALVRDHLAGKEMEIGRFYQKRGQWLAATLRFRNVSDQYAATTHAPEAYYRLVESYLALGIPGEAKKAAALANDLYPGSKWVDRATELLADKT